MPLPDPPTTDRLHQLVLDALDTRIKEIVDEEAKSAALRVETRVRGMVGEIATRVCSYVHFERRANDLRITVELPEKR
jgi:hypothetical protein